MKTVARSRRLVDVFELARARGAIEGVLDLAAAERLRPILADAASVLSFRFAGRTDSRGRAAARLALRGEVVLVCDRCGSILRERIAHTADFYFVREEDELTGLPVVVDEPEPLLGDRSFDIGALVEDEAILCLPLSPRHESCPSVDERGGAGAAAVEPNPFAGLSGLLRKGR